MLEMTMIDVDDLSTIDDVDDVMVHAVSCVLESHQSSPPCTTSCDRHLAPVLLTFLYGVAAS